MPEYFGAASRAAQKELGGIFRPRETAVPVGTTQVSAAPYDSNRIGLVITNTGTTNITLSTQTGVVAGVGLLLLGNGAVMSLNYKDDADLVAAQFYAIGDVAAGSLHVFEMVQAFE